MRRNDLRNVAIIAHVDHGKTTLVDNMLRQSGLFRQEELDRLVGGQHGLILDFPTVYASGRQGVSTLDLNVPATDFKPLFDTILSCVPAPDVEPEQPLQMLVVTLDWSDYVGRIAVGKVFRGTLRKNQRIALL